MYRVHKKIKFPNYLLTFIFPLCLFMAQGKPNPIYLGYFHYLGSKFFKNKLEDFYIPGLMISTFAPKLNEIDI